MLKEKKILITGGSGFVGSHLAKHLSHSNSVYVLDNYFTGRKTNHFKNIKYLRGETIDIKKIFSNQRFDIIFHLGEYSRVEQSFEDIDKVIKYNTIPFYEVLKFAKKYNSKLIYSGSSTRYANYFKNNDTLSPYAWSKISNINFLKNYSKWYDLNYAITYFYNVYGPNEISRGKYSTVIAKFIDLKKNNAAFLPITKPGTQKRNFTHVNDVVIGLEKVALKGNGDGFGIGSDKSYSLIELARLFNMKYKFINEKKGNRMSGSLKTSKTKKLGWSCKYDLETYLKNIF